MKKPLNHLLFFIAVLSVATVSCRKDREDIDTTLGYEVGQFESMTNDVDNMVGQVRQGDGSISQRTGSGSGYLNGGGCAIVTHDTANQHITIDFGTGCAGADGRVRAGIINISYTGDYFTPGSTHTVTFDSFYVDTRHIEGNRTVTNAGFNNDSNMVWNINAVNMRITRTDGYWMSWNSTRTREMISGFGDLVWLNDVYKINGTANGSNSNGNTFTMSISNVIRDNSCHWLTSGTMVINPANQLARTVDFGNGNCDDQATVTVGNQSRTITLR
ncbi:MAG: hypothetical protein ACKO1U_02210 [Bacteroidota bacterium]